MADTRLYIKDLSAQTQLYVMDYPTRARLSLLKANGGATDAQKTWSPDAVMPDANAAPYNFGTLDWRALYKAFLHTFNVMSVEKDADKFLAQFYGAGLAVEKYTFNVTEPTIAADISVLLGRTDVQDLLYTNGYTENSADLIASLGTGTFRTDPKMILQLQQVVGILYQDQRGMGGGLHIAPVNEARLEQFYINSNSPAFATVPVEFETKLPKIFEELIKNEKVRAIFEKSDKSRLLAGPMAEGLKKTHYKDGDNILTAHNPDKRNILQQGVKNVKDAADDHLGKYFSKEKRKNMPDNAREIFDEINKLKIKRIDGLAKLLENADKIKGELQSNFPAAVGDFDGLIKGLKGLSKTEQFKQALYSGKSMRNLIEDLSDQATTNDKATESAKRMQFVLKALTYGKTTFKSREGLRGIDYNIAKDTSFGKVGNNAVAMGIRVMLQGTVMLATEFSHLGVRVLRGMGENFDGSSKIKNIEYALKQVATDPRTLADFKSNAAAARDAYEKAFRIGSKDIKKLEKTMNAADLLVQAKERNDELVSIRGGVTPPKTYLHRKLELMAHWDMVESGEFTDLSLFKHSSTEKKMFNEKDVAGKTKYDKTLETYLQNWNKGMAA